jgi:hypothetical protein
MYRLVDALPAPMQNHRVECVYVFEFAYVFECVHVPDPDDKFYYT